MADRVENWQTELNIDSEDVLKVGKSGANRLTKDEVIKSFTNDLFDEFENEDIPAHIREARLNELKMRAREQQYIQENKNEIYKEIKEDEFLSLTTNKKKCVVHFFHPDFRRCDIMHNHLQKLSKKYLNVNFAKINVEKAKFFVNKLNIQVLPAVLLFVDGILKHKIIGFDQLDNSDNFPTKTLEKKFWKLDFVAKPDDASDVDSDEETDDFSKKKSSIIKKSSKTTNQNDSESD